MSKNKKILAGVALGAMAATLGFCIGQNHVIAVRRYTYTNETLPQSICGMKLAVLSDLHNKSFGRDNARLIEKIAGENPDMILIAGDLLDENTEDRDEVGRLIRKLTVIAPVIYVPGNHEQRMGGYAQTAEMLSEYGATVMDGGILTLTEDGGGVGLIGMPDPTFYGGNDAFAAALLTQISQSLHQTHFLLTHRPELLETYTLCGVEMVMAGHAHGGQICLPGGIPLVAPNQGFFPKLAGGEHAQGGTTLFVSRGLGASIVNFRLFNTPEIMIIELSKTG